MKTSILLFFCFLYSLSPAQTFDWVNQLGGMSSDVGKDVVVDDSGNVYTCGTFNNSIDVDAGTGVHMLIAVGQQDIYVVKTTPNGNFVWAKQFGGSLFDQVTDIALDETGHVYIAGTFSSAADMDPGSGIVNFTAFGGQDGFLVKLNTGGDFVWAKQFGGTLTDWLYAIAVDALGNVYLSGAFQGGGDFDPGMGTTYLMSNGDMDMVVVKLNTFGDFVWANHVGDIGEDISYGIALDDHGYVYTTGWFKYTVDFDPGTSVYNLTTIGSVDLFVSKLDTAGNFIWVKQIGGTVSGKGFDITVDAFDNILFTGTFQGTLDFNPGIGVANISAVDMDDIYVCKLRNNGAYVWAKGFGGNGFDGGNALVCDVAGNVYTVGYFAQTVDFDAGTGVVSLTAAGFDDMFIQKLDSLGNFNWTHGLGSINFDNMNGVCVNNYNAIFIAGSFTNTVDFDPSLTDFTLSTTASADAFVLKLNQCDTVLPPTNTTDSTHLSICYGAQTTLHANGTGMLYWYTSPTGDTLLGSGNTFTTTPLFSNTTFYVKDSNCMESTATAIDVTVKPALNTLVHFSAGILQADIAGSLTPEPIYQWLNCSDTSIIGGETNATYTPLTNGAYALVVTHNGCSDTSTCMNITDVGIAYEDSENTILVYPNPAHEVLHVLADEPIVWLQLIHVSGALVYENRIPKTQHTIALTLPSGIYFLSVVTAKQHINKYVTIR